MLSGLVLKQFHTYLKSQVGNGWSVEGRKSKGRLLTRVSFRYLSGERSVVLLDIDFDAENQDDIEGMDLNRPEMNAKLLNTLEQSIYLALKKGNYSAVAANGKVLMRLIGLDTQNVNHQHRFKHGRLSAYY